MVLMVTFLSRLMASTTSLKTSMHSQKQVPSLVLLLTRVRQFLLSVLALVMRRQSQTTSPSSVKLVSSSRLVMKSQLFLVLQLVLRWHSNLDYSIIRRVGFRVSPFLFYM